MARMRQEMKEGRESAEHRWGWKRRRDEGLPVYVSERAQNAKAHHKRVCDERMKRKVEMHWLRQKNILCKSKVAREWCKYCRIEKSG